MGDSTKFRNTNPLKKVPTPQDPASSEDLFGDLLAVPEPAPAAAPVAPPAPPPAPGEPHLDDLLGGDDEPLALELPAPAPSSVGTGETSTGPRLVLLDPPESPEPVAAAAPPETESGPSVELIEIVDSGESPDDGGELELQVETGSPAAEPVEDPTAGMETPEQRRIASLTRLVARAREEQEKIEKKLTETRRERDEARRAVEGAEKAKAAAEAAADRARAETGAVRGHLEGKVEEAKRNGPEALIGELLPVVDYLDMALKAAPPGDPLVTGVEMTRKAMIDALSRFDVKVVPTDNVPFDPKIHEASAVESRPDLAGPTVIEVLRRGWTRGPKTLRAALVKVGKPPEA